MSYKIAIQMDKPASLNLASDTTVILGSAGQKRGHSIYYYHPSTLYLRGGVVRANMAKITFTDNIILGDFVDISLTEMDVILMRQDPPFDINYLTATYLLEMIADEVFITNSPFYVRNLPEKIFPLEFAQYMPPTMIAGNVEQIKSFLAEHKDIVIKPLHGHGGRGVFRLKYEGYNIDAILEIASKEPLTAQKFLPEVATQDKRIILINGEIEGVLGRIPQGREIRANMCLGGLPAIAELSEYQTNIAKSVGKILKERDILLAGLDLIGDYLTEINITSPTGLQAIKNLYNINPEIKFWQVIEKKLQNNYV